VRKSKSKIRITPNDGDPWSPVDQSATSLEAVKPQETKGGDVTAHINLGGDTLPVKEKTPEEPTGEEKRAADEAASDDSDIKSDETAAEVEAAEDALAEKLAALDAARTGKKTAKK
jgi:hypothetical protein